MSRTPTPHNAAQKGDFAKIVLMPGDPLRAKYIAETYLSDVRQVTGVRNMLGFTGTYKGKELSVMGHGMGMPSIGIYSYELYHNYDVDAIIRVGSAGGYADDLQLRDVVVAMGACTDSNYAYQYNLPGTFAPIADYELLSTAVETAKRQGVPVRVGQRALERRVLRWRRQRGRLETHGRACLRDGIGSAIYERRGRRQKGPLPAHHLRHPVARARAAGRRAPDEL